MKIKRTLSSRIYFGISNTCQEILKQVQNDKNWFKIALICIFIPNIAFASIGDQLNSLLNRFFGSEKPQEQVVESSEPLSIPDVEVPETPTESDVIDFRRQIQEEEEALADFEMELTESQGKLWQIQSEKNLLRQQLEALDGELGLASQKLETLITQEEKWKKELKAITREKSDLKALIRVRKKELDNLLNKKFVQEESFGSAESVSILKWLFSTKSVGQILEENREDREKETQRKAQLQNLESLKQKLDNKESHIAMLFHETSSLHDRITQEKQSLDTLTQAKANLIARMEYSQGQIQKEMDNYKREQNQSTVLLQNLHQALKEIEDKVGEVPDVSIPENESVFEFPLPIPQKVTASFGDTEYKKRFDRDHIGVDFYAPQGTDILAPRDGTVQKVALNGYGYSYLILDHGHELYTVYGHISDSLVNEGQKVAKGDIIAKTGGTPGTVGAGFFTTGPHLHWEVFDRGKHRDPIKYLP